MSVPVADRYSVVVHSDVLAKVGRYRQKLHLNEALAGGFLKRVLGDSTSSSLSVETFLEALVQTKCPRIFAESEVQGNGSDWNQDELSILGDIGFVVPVEVYDDGRHHHPEVHDLPFSAELLFIPGALLRSNGASLPADWNEVVKRGEIDFESYYRLYERRLLPLLKYVDSRATQKGRKALVTVPGLGCGQFAGKFQGTLGTMLERVLYRLLEEHGCGFCGIQAVYYDPFNEGSRSCDSIHGIRLITNPLALSSEGKPQLCKPASYGKSFENCDLYSFVAWDHVSWPGNDFYAGVRATDDGVKAAATDVMMKLTGILGTYNARLHQYLPPENYTSWEEVVLSKGLRLKVKEYLCVFP